MIQFSIRAAHVCGYMSAVFSANTHFTAHFAYYFCWFQAAVSQPCDSFLKMDPWMKRAWTLPSPVSAEPGHSQSCPCSTKRVSWPHRTLKTTHINQLSPLPVRCSGGRAESTRQVDIWRGPEAPGQVSQRPEAQPISVTLLLERRGHAWGGGGLKRSTSLIYDQR